MKYILDEQNQPVECPDVLTWGRWFEASGDQCKVGHTTFDGGYVSTVFLGLDHNFTQGEPVLWETMIFGGPHDGFQDRYTSRATAELGHQKAVKLATAAGDRRGAVDATAGL